MPITIHDLSLRTVAGWSLAALGTAGLVVWLMDTEKAKISRLTPDTAAKWAQLVALARSRGYEIRAISTVRTIDLQRALAALGRSSQNVGWHNLGRAIDFQVRGPDGVWDDKAIHRDRYLAVARLAESLGFRQLGFNADGSRRILRTKDGRPYEDPYHIEYRGPYATLTAAVKAEAPDLLPG